MRPSVIARLSTASRRRARWVAIQWNSTEPRLEGGRMLVRVPR